MDEDTVSGMETRRGSFTGVLVCIGLRAPIAAMGEVRSWMVWRSLSGPVRRWGCRLPLQQITPQYDSKLKETILLPRWARIGSDKVQQRAASIESMSCRIYVCWVYVHAWICKIEQQDHF